MSWIDFWDGAPPIYVNERHRLLHGRAVAADIVSHVPSPAAVVLDYGCGEALSADEVAAACARLILCDAAQSVRAKLQERFAGNGNVQVASPEGVEALEDASLDLVIVNSLMQYLDPGVRDALLMLLRDKLKPEGRLIVADIVPPDVSPLADATALLRFGLAGGFLLAALGGLARTALSGYGKLRRELGFATYTEEQFIGVLENAGFEARRIRPNFGHNQARMAFEARPGQP